MPRKIVAATRTDQPGSSVGFDSVLSASVIQDDRIGDSSHGDQSVFSIACSVAATRVDHLGSAGASVSPHDSSGMGMLLSVGKVYPQTHMCLLTAEGATTPLFLPVLFPGPRIMLQPRALTNLVPLLVFAVPVPPLSVMVTLLGVRTRLIFQLGFFERGHDRIWPNRIWPELVFLVFWPCVCVSRFWVCSTHLVGVFKIFGGCLQDFWWVSSRFWVLSGPLPLRAPPLPESPSADDGPKISLFFSLSRHHFALFVSLWGSSRGIFDGV